MEALSGGSHQHSHFTTDSCPWCGSEITHEKFEQIQEKIRSEERRLRDLQRVELEREHADQLAGALAAQRAEAARSQSEALAGQRMLLVAERDAAKIELSNARADLDGTRTQLAEERERIAGRIKQLET